MLYFITPHLEGAHENHAHAEEHRPRASRGKTPLRHVADGIVIVGCAFVFSAVVLLRKPRRYFPAAIGTSSESEVIA